jgi:hypothetical protein
MNILKKINEKNLVILSLFSFVYFWGLTIGIFNFRYLIFLPSVIVIYKIFKNKKFIFLKIPLYILIFLYLHLLINLYFFDINISPRKYFEVAAVFLVSIFVIYYKEMIMENIHVLIKVFIYSFPIIFISNAIYGYLIFKSGSGHIPIDGRLIFNCDNSLISFSRIFFKENSHLGMIAAPTIISTFFFKKFFFNKLFIVFFSIFLFINFLFFSTTLLVGIFLSCLVFIFYFSLKKEYSKILILLILLIPILLLMQHKTCEKKISETGILVTNNLTTINDILKNKKKERNEKQTNKKNEIPMKNFNASSSVHFYSLILAKNSIKKNFLGHGINNYSVAFDRYTDELEWFNKLHDYVKIMNTKDGSNNLAKLIVEFGIFAFLLIPLFLKFLFFKGYDDYQKFFILSILITQLGRGAGYFNGGFLIGILIIIIFNFKKKNVA